MRIIGGSAGGRLLKVPKGLAVRPTPDLVRQAIFNSLGPRVEGARVLELFAGSGALSLECLSRGAVHAVSVEKCERHAQFLRLNAEAAGFGHGHLEVRVQDAFTALSQLAGLGQSFDLILADPPYGEKNIGRRSTSLAQQLLDHPGLPGLIVPGGLFVLGHARRDQVTVAPHWEDHKVMKHGDTMMRFLRRGPGVHPDGPAA